MMHDLKNYKQELRTSTPYTEYVICSVSFVVVVLIMGYAIAGFMT